MKSRLILILCALAMSGCVATYRNHGYAPNQDALADIVVGVDTRDTVAEAVGEPSSKGVLSDGGYYYVASRMRFYGPREPREVSRRLVAITFDNAGVVDNIVELGLEDGRVVSLDRRVTDSSVSDNTFLRQLFGSLGNFNPGQFID